MIWAKKCFPCPHVYRNLISRTNVKSQVWEYSMDSQYWGGGDTCTNMDTQALLHDSVYIQGKNPWKKGQLEFTRMMWHTQDLVNSRTFLWTLSMESLKFQITCCYILPSLGSLAKVGLSLSHSRGSLPPSLLISYIHHKAEFPARNTFGTMSYSQGGLHR